MRVGVGPNALHRHWPCAAVLILGWAIGTMPRGAQALPMDWTIEEGSASFEQTDPQTLHITASDQAIVGFQTFDLGASEVLHLHQPSSSSSFLSRVTGGTPSELAGTLLANGRFFLVNPAGIHIQETARIQTASFVASSLNISNSDFLKGRLAFERLPGQAPAPVVNEGTVRSGSEGLIAFLGGSVSNNGQILAEAGSVVLGAGNKITLTFDPESRWAISIDEPLDQIALGLDGSRPSSAIEQTGTIAATGGQILVKAQALEGLFDQLVNQEGLIEATGIVERAGQIELMAEGGTLEQAGRIRADGIPPAPNGGRVLISGTRIISPGGIITAVGAAGGQGGTVHLLGDQIALVGESQLDVSGELGAGQVWIGGDFHGQGTLPRASQTYLGPQSQIRADALTHGQGGRIIIWSDEATDFYGSLSARGGADSGDGGFAEVSSRERLGFQGRVDLGAFYGRAGTLLLDPRDITIVNGSGGAHNGQLSDGAILFGDIGPNVNATISENTLEALTGNVILQARRDILLNSLTTDGNLNLSGLTSGESVVFQAGRHVRFNNTANALTTAGASIHLEADSPHSSLGAADGTGTLTLGKLTSQGGAITLIGANFALNNTIDAGPGGIHLARSRESVALNLGSSGQLIQAELDRLQTSGTLTLGQAATGGTDGLGAGALSRQARTLSIAGSSNVTIASASGATLHLLANDGITLSRSLTTNQPTEIQADVDADDNSGTFTVNNSRTLSTSGNALILRANDLNLNAAGSLTTSGAALTLIDSDGSGIGAGGGLISNGLNISASELQRMASGSLTLQTGGDIAFGAVAGGSVHLNAGGDILDGNGSAVNLTATGDSTLIAAGTIGTATEALEVSVTGAGLGVSAGSEVGGTSVNIDGVVTPSNTLDILNTPPGQVIFNGNVLFPPPVPPPVAAPTPSPTPAPAPGPVIAQSLPTTPLAAVDFTDFFSQVLSRFFSSERQQRLRAITG